MSYRLALDHSDRVERLAVLDMVPTLDTAERTDWSRAHSSYHWYFLAQPSPLPEKLIGSDPEYYIRHTLESWAGDPAAFTPEAIAEYIRCYQKPSMIRATCEDYRAGLTIDLEIDRADREAGRKIMCPVLSIWGAGHGKGFNPPDIWRRWADDVQGVSLDCGHFVMEEAPVETADALIKFFQA